MRLAQRIGRAVRKQPARVFTPADFLDLGTPHAVGMALSRMVSAGKLRRVARGLYRRAADPCAVGGVEGVHG